jgi:SAM-dependent methyltransferase
MSSAPTSERRFRTAAAHYLNGRPAYAALLVRRVLELTGADRTSRVMDLAWGPGQIAVAVAPSVAAVVAVDPEAEMLAIAERQAADAGLAIRFVQGYAETLDPALGPFRLVTIGRAFHWMDQVRTLERLDAMIEPGGAIAFFGDRHLDVPDNDWCEAYDALVDRYAAADATHPRHAPRPWRHETRLLDSPFSLLERIGTIERRRTPVEALVDRALSKSSTAPDRLGAQAETLADEIRHLMGSRAPDGLVTEVIESHALIARRPT